MEALAVPERDSMEPPASADAELVEDRDGGEQSVLYHLRPFSSTLSHEPLCITHLSTFPHPDVLTHRGPQQPTFPFVSTFTCCFPFI